MIGFTGFYKVFENDNDEVINNVYRIKLPNNLLEALTLKDGYYSRRDEKVYGMPKINLKVSTTNGTRVDKYYLLDSSGTRQVEKVEYTVSLDAGISSTDKSPNQTIHVISKGSKCFKIIFNSSNKSFF